VYCAIQVKSLEECS